MAATARRLALAAIAVVLALPPPATASDATGTAEFVAGEVVVRYEPGTTAAERRAVRSRIDASLEERVAIPRMELLDLTPGGSVRAAVAELEGLRDVSFAEPNFLYQPTVLPNDTDFDQLWGLNNVGQDINGTGGSLIDADIDAPEAWNTEQGESGVQVAVVDTGISLGHPDLAGNLWTNPAELDNGLDDDDNGLVDDVAGWDFAAEDEDPSDLDGHGTHVAGTIGAEGNNTTGVTGVNWDVSLMPLRACSLDGCPNVDVAAAFSYAAEMGADVVNASLSGPGSSFSRSSAVASAPDTLFVVAAGNDSEDNDSTPQTPCNIAAANLICVAASNRTDGLASFSNFGPESVDLAAPGIVTRSTYPFETPDPVSQTFSSASNPPIGPGWTRGGHPKSWARTTEATSLSGGTLADSPGGDYDPSADNHARFGPVNLTGMSGCHLRYQLALDLEGNILGADRLFVESSTDGDNFTTLETLDQDDDVTKETRVVDLDTVSGMPSVYIRFHLVANGDGAVGDGAHIDNFRIRCPADEYHFLSGTSMATPHVSGAAALLRAQNPAASVEDLRAWLLDGVDLKPAFAGVVASGGRLNLARSLAGAGGADIHRPQTTIGSGPTAAGTRGPASFGFAADEQSSFRCSVDGAAPTSCSSPSTYRRLALGLHRFSVYAIDQAGNIDRTPAARDFRIKRTKRCRTLRRKLRRARARHRRLRTAETKQRVRVLRRERRRACRTF